MESMQEHEDGQHHRMIQHLVCFDTDVCSHDTSAVLVLRLIAAYSAWCICRCGAHSFHFCSMIIPCIISEVQACEHIEKTYFANVLAYTVLRASLQSCCCSLVKEMQSLLLMLLILSSTLLLHKFLYSCEYIWIVYSPLFTNIMWINARQSQELTIII